MTVNRDVKMLWLNYEGYIFIHSIYFRILFPKKRDDRFIKQSSLIYR